MFRGDKLTEKLSDEEWADFTCEIVFDLLHPEDTLTLRIVGLFVDPLSVNAPLHFRLLFALKKALKIDENKALSKQIMSSAATFCEDKGKRQTRADNMGGRGQEQPLSLCYYHFPLKPHFEQRIGNLKEPP